MASGRIVGVPAGLQITSGGGHSIVLQTDGLTAAAGLNDNGQFGNGTQTNSRVHAVIPGFSLVDNAWLKTDEDNDGLGAWQEWLAGTDPYTADTNGNGLLDGIEESSGASGLNPDTDGDGVTNAAELQLGTDPYLVDSDGDEVPDGLDVFPVDPTRSSLPAPTPGDTTPPIITLTEPAAARLVYDGAITPGGAPVVVQIDSIGDSGRLAFDGTSGQRVSLVVTNSNLANFTQVTILDPNGIVLRTGQIQNGQCFLEPFVLAATGKYTIAVDPAGGTLGSATLTLADVPGDITGTIVIAGGPVTVSPTVPGQNARLTFSGTATKRITLQMASVTIASAWIAIKNPDGSTLDSTTVGPAGGAIVDRTPSATGTYTVLIDPQAANTGSITLTLHAASADPVTVSLSCDRSFPSAAGTTMTWTALASGGTGPYHYQFWLYSSALNTWRIVQEFSGTQTFAWTPAAADRYAIHVRIRKSDSTSEFDNSATSDTFDVTSRPPLAVKTFTSSVVFPVPTGTPVTWTATATGGAAPLQYQLWIGDPVVGWYMLRDYGSSNTNVWTPLKPGTYNLQVWARSTGSTATYEAWRANTGTVTITDGPVSIVSVKADKTSPIAPGSTVKWSVEASGGATALEYRFDLFAQSTGVWTTARAYGTSPTWTWTASSPDVYVVRARVRAVGSTAEYDATWESGQLTVVSGPIVNLATKLNVTFPVAAPTLILVTAQASGGTAPPRIQVPRTRPHGRHLGLHDGVVAKQ